MAIWYVDLEGSAGSGDGTSFANRSNALATIVNAAANGDEIRVKESEDPVSIGSCTWQQNGTVSLPAGTTKDIYVDGAWVAAPNVTAVANISTSFRKQGINSSQITPAAAFTTGRLAHFTLPAVEDFSAYTKISLWMLWSIAQANTNIYQIVLCSDTAGAVPVNTLTLPNMNVLANRWTPLLLDNGGPLGASIQSIAIYATTDPVTPNIYIDNIFATNDVSLLSLLTPNTNAEWYSPRSIFNNEIIIDQGLASPIATAPRGYPNNTTTVETFISDGVRLPHVAASATNLFLFSKVASDGSPVTISGGWNRTDMSTKTWNTHVCVPNTLGRITISGRYLILENFIISKCADGVSITNSNNTIRNCVMAGLYAVGIAYSNNRNFTIVDNCFISNCTIGITYTTSRLCTTSNTYVNNCTNQGIVMNTCNYFTLSDVESKNNGTIGLDLTTSVNNFLENIFVSGNTSGMNFSNAHSNVIQTITNIDNTQYAFININSLSNQFRNATTSGNGIAAINSNTTGGDIWGFLNWNRSEIIPANNLNSYDGARYISINDGSTENNHIVYTDGGRISSDEITRHSDSGISWKLQPTSSLITEIYPLIQRLNAIPLKANVEHSISMWVYRDSLDISFKFGHLDIPGEAAQTVSLSGDVDEWIQLTLTVTPNIDVIADFFVAAYGGISHTVYWDDFSVTAASKNNVSSGDYGYMNLGVYITNYPTDGIGGGEVSHVFCS